MIPVRRANRAHKAVHYAPLRAQLIAATRKQPSLRTVQRYGHDDAIKKQRTKKRTANERKLALHLLSSVWLWMVTFCCSGC